MIIIEVKSGELEKCLKKLKRKFEATKVVKELRYRKEYTKPSEERRSVVNKSIYINKKYGHK